MPGQFTRRGGIFDIYSAEADRPIRVEFFYLLFGALVVTIVLVMLVLFRKHNP